MGSNKNYIIKNLEEKLLKVFKDEFDSIKPQLGEVDGEAIFNRFKKTTKFCNPDTYISALCLRLTQAGYPCYPIKDEPEYLGIKCSLRDDEVTDVIHSYGYTPGNVQLNIQQLLAKPEASFNALAFG